MAGGALILFEGLGVYTFLIQIYIKTGVSIIIGVKKKAK